jgi:hypothetical protein
MKEIANVAARAKVERDYCDRITDLLGERRDVIDPSIVSLSPPGASCLGRVFSFRERASSLEGG